MSDLIGKLGRDLIEEKEEKLSQDQSNVPGITTQDQLNELTRIQTNLGYQISDLIGKLGRELVEEKEEKLSTSQTQTQLRESPLATFQAASFQADEIKRIRASERLSNPGRSERLSLQHGRSERLAQVHLDEIQRIRASKRRADAYVAQVQRLTQDPEHNQFRLYEARDVSFSPTTSSSTHCTSVRGTIHPHRNVVATVPTVSATSSTLS